MQIKLIFVALIFTVGVKIASTDGDDGGGGGGEKIKFFRDCVQEFSIAREDARGVLAGNLTKVTENIQCFVKCFMTKTNIMDEENNFNPEVLIEKFSKIFNREKVEQRTQKCESIAGESSCEKAYNIFKCLRERREKQ